MKDRDQIRAALVGASIANMAHDHRRAGRGAPDVEDMKRFIEEAEAIAALYDEAQKG